MSVNTLMTLNDDGTSRYNEVGIELDRKVYKAVKAILDEAIEENGAIDIRMFAHVASSACQEVALEKLF
tara:strand:- start:4652 stop:4858 length:207 start_codon:yes stop_codon:yes gene_type:complete